MATTVINEAVAVVLVITEAQHTIEPHNFLARPEVPTGRVEEGLQ